MKINKKIIIPLFSTVMGLSVMGGISGAIAWYQYNSRVTTSFVGTSVADTGVLQIGYMRDVLDQNGDPVTDNNGNHVQEMHWSRDYYETGEVTKLLPVTFGQLVDDDTDANNIRKNVLPGQAYVKPLDQGTGYSKWQPATAGKEYAQFDIYLRAYQSDKNEADGFKLVERAVFLSDYVLESAENDSVAEEALRIHLDVEGQDGHLLAKNSYTHDPSNNQEGLKLFGGLDFDKNGENDHYHETSFTGPLGNDENGDPLNGQEIVYGNKDEYQSTEALDVMKTTRTNGKMPRPTEEGYSKKLLKTKTDGAVKVTVTIWLEGWELLKTKVNDNGEVVKSNMWNPHFSSSAQVSVGLQFDTGIFDSIDDFY